MRFISFSGRPVFFYFGHDMKVQYFYQEALTGPSDLMLCFGTLYRMHNVNTSLNSKLVVEQKMKRNLFGNILLTNQFFLISHNITHQFQQKSGKF